MADACAVRVAVRVRPLTANESGDGAQSAVAVQDELNTVIVGSGASSRSIVCVTNGNIPARPSGPPAHRPTPRAPPRAASPAPRSYDSAFGPQQSNADVYTACVGPLLARALEGYHVTVFAYGQTGSGKTFTMLEGLGEREDAQGAFPPHVGVTPRLMRDLFSAVAGAGAPGSALASARVRVSCLEIYNENIYDLLSKDGAATAKSVVIRDNEAGEQVITGLSEVDVESAADMGAVMQRGMAARATASTAMNARSSRSHAIFTITLEQCIVGAAGEAGGAGDEALVRRTSRIHLVDLAGSERAKKTSAEGARLKEGAAINKSLLALGNVINALASAEDAAAEAGAGAG